MREEPLATRRPALNRHQRAKRDRLLRTLAERGMTTEQIGRAAGITSRQVRRILAQ